MIGRSVFFWKYRFQMRMCLRFWNPCGSSKLGVSSQTFSKNPPSFVLLKLYCAHTCNFLSILMYCFKISTFLLLLLFYTFWLYLLEDLSAGFIWQVRHFPVSCKIRSLQFSFHEHEFFSIILLHLSFRLQKLPLTSYLQVYQIYFLLLIFYNSWLTFFKDLWVYPFFLAVSACLLSLWVNLFHDL